MALDPQITALVDQVKQAAAAAPPVFDQSVEMLRDGHRKFRSLFPPGPEVASVVDEIWPGEVLVRIYRPTEAPTTGAIVFFHGGGWCVGTLDTYDAECRQLAHRSGATVVSVDYRLAPEHPFPAGVDDAWAATQTAWARRGLLTGRADSSILVAGDSAGGNLAAVVALMAREDAATGVDIAGQLLIYPSIDLRVSGYPSYETNGRDYLLTTDYMIWFSTAYVPDATCRDDWRASPIAASSHVGIAPALVVTAELDPLLDEGVAYAEALRAANVPVVHTNYEGMVHGFFQFGPAVDATDDLLDELAATARAFLDRRDGAR